MSDRSSAANHGPAHRALAAEPAFQLQRLHASNQLTISALPNGCIYAIERNGILINQLLASPLAGGIHRIYLRIHGPLGIGFTEIAGPRAGGRFFAAPDRLLWRGTWQGLRYACTAWLHPSGDCWFFRIDVENGTDDAIRWDAVMVQDVALATRGQARNNELFTSQYLDHHAFEHPEAGFVLMSRQNLPQPGNTHPWLLQGCLPRAAGFATDGFDFFSSAHRDGEIPVALPHERIGDRVRQYETAYITLQSRLSTVQPGATAACSFYALFEPDHPEASSAADADRLVRIRAMAEEMGAALRSPVEPADLTEEPLQRSVFRTCELYRADDLDRSELEQRFPERRHEELDGGRVLCFFHGADSRHVVLKAKELGVARPHGHILRAGKGWMPDEEVMSCTFYAAGVFASQLTLGNTSMAKLVSAVRDPLGIVRSSGLRIFIRHDPSRPWHLLGVPSAFEMAIDACHWHYQRGADRLTVSCIASQDDPALSYEVCAEGPPVELLISGEIACGPAEYEHPVHRTIDAARGRITVRPDRQSPLGERQPGISFHIVTSSPQAIAAIGGDELLLAAQQPQDLPYFAIQTRSAHRFSFTVLGTLSDGARAEALCARYEAVGAPGKSVLKRSPQVEPPRMIALAAPANRLSAIDDVLPWFARDAMVHLSTPRGLEQANGGAWGVRDVCQGPMEYLLSCGRPDVAAEILRRLFAQQYDDRYDWPQWFMFPPFEQIQSPECHGDVLIWPLKALCDYLEDTDDETILRDRLPYTDLRTFQKTGHHETILQHVDRLIGRMREQFLPGVSLPRYGEGDWDDSLQPADPLLRERMVSSWTAELMYQTLRRWGTAMAHFGEADRAAAADHMANAIAADFQRHMVPDGVVAGFALFEGSPPRAVEYLLHPSDVRTGLRYRLIPMTRGILSGIFSAQQASEHLALMREHLVFPDGARLMDRPTVYRGGKERTFRRSESAAFFGREIGLQYVHAHLRYAESLAAMGQADELWRALRVVNPIAVGEVVKNARRRQRNCYFSSSDAAFGDRYQAWRDYGKLRNGDVPVDAGWRIYSSGPGIYTSLVVRHFLGFRRYYDHYEFDPVLPHELDGSSCELTQAGRRIRYVFRVGGDGFSPGRILINGTQVKELLPAKHPYRRSAARVSKAAFSSALVAGANAVEIHI